MNFDVILLLTMSCTAYDCTMQSSAGVRVVRKRLPLEALQAAEPPVRAARCPPPRVVLVAAKALVTSSPSVREPRQARDLASDH